MNISIELPDEIADQISGRWGDLHRRAALCRADQSLGRHSCVLTT